MADRVPTTGRGEARRVVVAALAFGVVASLLNAETIYKTAQDQPLGARRRVSVTVAGWLLDASRALRLTGPRDAVEEVVHGDDDAPRPVATDRGPRPSTPPAVAERRTPTPDDPLRVLVVGDSLMFDAAPGIERRLSKLPQVRYRTATWLGSGLSNPDFYDWPSEMSRLVADFRPEAVVVMFGGNDWEEREVDGRVLRPGTREWAAFYREKVDEAVGILTSGGAHLYWLGMPDVRPDKIQRWVPTLNRVYRETVERWPGRVTFVDGAAALAGPDGGFSTYLPAGGGRVVAVRKPDGIHFLDAGADRLADAVMAELGPDWHLPGGG